MIDTVTDSGIDLDSTGRDGKHRGREIRNSYQDMISVK